MLFCFMCSKINRWKIKERGIKKEGREQFYSQMQEIIYSVSQGDVTEDEIPIKYNENDPQDYYTTGQTLSKSGMIGFIVKIVIMILLMLLFSSRKALDKIHIH